MLETLKPQKENRKPTLVKFSVDTPREALTELLEICESFEIAGYVATNTSSGRDGLLHSPKQKIISIGNGGLSGRAIADQSTKVIGWIADVIQGSKPIIGVGGIDSPKAAWEKLDAGADLLQVYTGMVYEGPGLIQSIKKELCDC